MISDKRTISSNFESFLLSSPHLSSPLSSPVLSPGSAGSHGYLLALLALSSLAVHPSPKDPKGRLGKWISRFVTMNNQSVFLVFNSDSSTFIGTVRRYQCGCVRLMVASPDTTVFKDAAVKRYPNIG
ncbi:unnamed protein product [Caenorhabditis nigoni]